MKTKILNIILSVILVVCVINIVGKLVDISHQKAEVESLNEQIKKQQRENIEYEDILDEKNTEDFYKQIAEDDLGLATGDETIYKNIEDK